MSVQVLILHLESSLHFVAGDVRQALKDVTAEHSLDVTQLQASTGELEGFTSMLCLQSNQQRLRAGA